MNAPSTQTLVDDRGLVAIVSLYLGAHRGVVISCDPGFTGPPLGSGIELHPDDPSSAKRAQVHDAPYDPFALWQDDERNPVPLGQVPPPGIAAKFHFMGAESIDDAIDRSHEMTFMLLSLKAQGYTLDQADNSLEFDPPDGHPWIDASRAYWEMEDRIAARADR
jgi:hypothetical protein